MVSTEIIRTERALTATTGLEYRDLFNRKNRGLYNELKRNVVNEYGKVITTFIGEQCTETKDQSRELYGRAILQYFIWIQATGRAMSTLTGHDIVQYSRELRERGLKSLTIGYYLTSVKMFYAWAESIKLYPNIAKVAKAPKRVQEHRRKHLAEDKSQELLSYFKAQSPRDYAIVALKLLRGLRNIEVTRANIEDITLETYTDSENRTQTRRVLKLQRKGHTEKDGIIVLGELYEPIKKYLETRKGAKGREPLFKCSSNHSTDEGRLTTHSVSRICKTGLRAIGLDSKDFTAHSLRHTTACMVLKKGGSLTDAQAILGHSNPATTQIYTKDIEREQRLEKAPELILDGIFL